jgi:hypothetical protein
MIDRNGNVDRVGELATGHQVLIGLSATGQDDWGLADEALTPRGAHQSLACVRIAGHDEAPFLPVAGRRGQPGGLQEAR